MSLALDDLHAALVRCDREIAIAYADTMRDERWALAYYDWHVERRLVLAEIERTQEMGMCKYTTILRGHESGLDQYMRCPCAAIDGSEYCKTHALEHERTQMSKSSNAPKTEQTTIKAVGLRDAFNLKIADTKTGEVTNVGESYQRDALNAFADLCFEHNKRWWIDLSKPCTDLLCIGWLPSKGVPCPDCPTCGGTGYERKNRNVGEQLMLCVSELAEALEGHRKNLQDDKLPDLPMFDVELADCLIRIFDLCGGRGIDIGNAFVRKMEYNLNRADHKIENRTQPGGKAY